MKYSNYVSQYTQKLQILAYIKKNKQTKKQLKNKSIPTKQLNANFYIPFNKVPGQQSA